MNDPIDLEKDPKTGEYREPVPPAINWSAVPYALLYFLGMFYTTMLITGEAKTFLPAIGLG